MRTLRVHVINAQNAILYTLQTFVFNICYYTFILSGPYGFLEGGLIGLFAVLSCVTTLSYTASKQHHKVL